MSKALLTKARTRKPAAWRLRDVRILARWVAASLLLHAALIVAWPSMQARDGARVEVLSVTLARPEPPSMLEAPAPQPRERLEDKRAKRANASPAPRVQDAAPEAAPRPALALPRPAVEAEPAFAVAPAPPAETVSRPEAAKAAPRTEPVARSETAKSAPPAEAPVTPPNFNAAYLRNPPPRYPLIARRNGEQGMVTLRVLVTREGLPSSVSVQASSGVASLDQAAVEAVKGWRFAPARQGAQPVEAWVLVPIVFKLEGVS